MAKLHLLDQSIRTWTPNDEADPCIAMIGRNPMFFYGKTSLQAYMAAENWRKEAVQKMARKDHAARNRLEARSAAKSEMEAENAPSD